MAAGAPRLRNAAATASPKRIAPEAFSDAAAAVARLEEIYERNTAFLRQRFQAYLKGEKLASRVRAVYPFVRITTETRPDLFRGYFTEQIRLLIQNHRVAVEVGESDEPIPVHFAYRRDISSEAGFAGAPTERMLRDFFDVPDLATM